MIDNHALPWSQPLNLVEAGGGRLKNCFSSQLSVSANFTLCFQLDLLKFKFFNFLLQSTPKHFKRLVTPLDKKWAMTSYSIAIPKERFTYVDGRPPTLTPISLGKGSTLNGAEFSGLEKTQIMTVQSGNSSITSTIWFWFDLNESLIVYPFSSWYK